MTIEPKPERVISQALLSQKEQIWWKNYTKSLTDEDFEEMRQITDVDVMSKLQAHIATLKSDEDS